jgi:hypothetical protein
MLDVQAQSFFYILNTHSIHIRTVYHMKGFVGCSAGLRGEVGFEAVETSVGELVHKMPSPPPPLRVKT